MTEPIRKSEELHLGASQTPVVRIVLGEVDAPGSLHYLLESEGFVVVARASDEVELARVLENGLDPDVVVLDTDISAESVLVARERAPAAHVIVVWPDGVRTSPTPNGSPRGSCTSSWVRRSVVRCSVRGLTWPRTPSPRNSRGCWMNR